MGAGHQKNQDGIRNLEFSNPPYSPEGKVGLRMELMISQAMCGSFHEIPKIWGLENFQVRDHIHMGWGVIHPNFMGIEPPTLGTFPDLALCISLTGCSSVSLIISFNDLANVS